MEKMYKEEGTILKVQKEKKWSSYVGIWQRLRRNSLGNWVILIFSGQKR